ncbi:MAG: SLOG family protein [Byssovorax sp.]
MRVIVAGAVAWSNEEAIRRELGKLPAGSVVIHGDSPGADALAGRVAAALGLGVEAMAKSREDYAKYKRGAWKGLNERMLARGVARVLVFHPAIEQSRGSGHLLRLAREAGVEVSVFAA